MRERLKQLSGLTFLIPIVIIGIGLVLGSIIYVQNQNWKKEQRLADEDISQHVQEIGTFYQGLDSKILDLAQHKEFLTIVKNGKASKDQVKNAMAEFDKAIGKEQIEVGGQKVSLFIAAYLVNNKGEVLVKKETDQFIKLGHAYDLGRFRNISKNQVELAHELTDADIAQFAVLPLFHNKVKVGQVIVQMNMVALKSQWLKGMLGGLLLVNNRAYGWVPYFMKEEVMNYLNDKARAKPLESIDFTFNFKAPDGQYVVKGKPLEKWSFYCVKIIKDTRWFKI